MVYIIRKFDPEKHHRQSCRIKGYDYSQEGSYFVMIKSYYNARIFGQISGKLMVLNDFGKIVYDEWVKTQLIRKNVTLGEFIIMPDHFHGILIITNPDTMQKIENDVFVQNMGTMHRAHILNDPTILQRNPMMHPSNMYYNGHQLYSFFHQPIISDFKCHVHGKSEQFGKPTVNTIPSIIRGFKSTVTKQINDNNGSPGKEVWQRSYYLRIIESQNEFYRTIIYIKENPQNSDT